MALPWYALGGRRLGGGEAEMATEPKNQRLAESHRQVLEVLAITPQGRGVNDLLTLGFKL
jgi:hypothetical protein